ncbi:MAG: Uma2 family endonuclease [Bacteroidota bacterium]
MATATSHESGLSLKHWSVEEYHRLQETGLLTEADTVELLAGKIVYMSPINSTHADIVDNLMEWLLTHIDSDKKIRVQNPITLGKSEPEPDLAVVNRRSYREHHPFAPDVFLVIEVSDSTLQKDRDIKLPIYAAANIAEYWIVNIPMRCIEVYTKPNGKQYDRMETFRPGDDLHSSAVGRLAIATIL